MKRVIEEAHFIEYWLHGLDENLLGVLSHAHESFDDGIEEEQSDRYADESEQDAETLAELGLHGHVAVTDRGQDRAGEEHSLAERPVGFFGDVGGGRYAFVVRLRHDLDELVELVVGETRVVHLTKSTHELVQLVDDASLVRRLESVEDERAEEQIPDIEDDEHEETRVRRLRELIGQI